ncbi:hypothetical protein FHW68_003870 [Pseudomonas sp. Tn43]|uniref:SpvB/TcaC N-terminal domain-containing protein n=1 Tax=Pseudomonas sp. Tn43 TaxID=701213 RepID=UPI00160A28DA|nr:SpvB/TcaC N-terminal domain-containing protein [Pseudomonas sp. Tn43]MBB3242328.1 hypothetical protein [Pseudomonas sp. Tn43]
MAMENQGTLDINPPSLPKGGGAIQSIGKGWGPIGTRGAASLELPLPISAAPNRRMVPALKLGYSSDVGNSPFGIGWTMTVNAISLRTTLGVPRYDGSDQVVGPDGEVWMPERDVNRDIVISRTEETYGGRPVGEHQVVRYWPRVEGAFNLIEHWSTADDAPGFWLIHGADGSLHVYGKTLASRRADPQNEKNVGVWLLDESLNSLGEHVVYEYQAEVEEPAAPQFRDYRAQRYLRRVYYGNCEADTQLYAWNADGWKDVQWHFHLLFDYGERSAELTKKPVYGPPYLEQDDEYGDWQVRSDPFCNYAFGFELGTRRLCRQVLMFHHFHVELGEQPVLVQRLLLEHRPSILGYNHLTAAHIQAYDSMAKVESRPPMEFTYTPFELRPDLQGCSTFPNMPALNDGQHYQWVDLYGEGLPGVLFRSDQAWYYREPLRADTGSNDVCYSDWRVLPHLPTADSSKPVYQALSDLNGDGKLDWMLAQPGLSGFFTLNPDRSWSKFVTFDAFPREFFHPEAQLADLVGNGLMDMALIGHRSVRLYTSKRDKGFAAGINVPHPNPEDENDDTLPLPNAAETELVAFSDVLGSGQQHLIRIRHNEVKCWPNLGHGRFGKGFVLCALPFTYAEFNASQVVLADLDGSGASDLIYLQSDRLRVFMNHSGKGYELTSVDLPWPKDIRYDNLCQISIADLQGLGCSSLILSVPHMKPSHWRYDFVTAKPYLVSATHNNMGTSTGVTYRSSAQEWLDEKQALLASGKDPVSDLPIAVHLVSQQTQLDEITGNRLTQCMRYRQGYYDGIEREFRGFGLLLQTDSEISSAEQAQAGFTTPTLSKTWFHTGKAVDLALEGDYRGDSQAHPLEPTLLQGYDLRDRAVVPLAPPDNVTVREMARALSGSVLRTEVFAAGTAEPYAIQQHRYLIRLLRPKGPHQPYAVMQPLLLESISYQYEPPVSDDPLCQHTINLTWDEYGGLTHGFTINYARRKTPADTPPFDDTHENTWWSDAHDQAQQCWYLTQTKAEYIHLPDTQAWRLALPYRQRSNALMLDKAALSPENISHETFLQWSKDDGEWARQSVLTSLSLQRYKHPVSGDTLPVEQATFEALPDYLEVAELDATALSAYDRLKDEHGVRPFHLKARLKDVGYQIMDVFLPELETPPDDDPTKDDPENFLWSVKRGFPTYHGLDGFYSVEFFRQTQNHDLTKVSYDQPYWCLSTAVELPDGCITRTLGTDYRSFLPVAIEDPNGNIQEGRYNAFGEVLVSSFHGSEHGVNVGFHSLRNYVPPDDRAPARAIAAPRDAVGNFASAIFSDPFSWMGRISRSAPPLPQWLAWAIAEGFVLPDGHIRARARQHLQELENLTPNELILQAQIDAAQPEPVHVVTLQADRYPADPERQIRVAVVYWDGFGRVLQTKQEVEPGKAWVVDENGDLTLKDDGTPLEADALRRWRVSERVEYNNKGLAIRIYRPYFADQFRYIHDESLRQHGFCDKQYYDCLGRPVRTLAAKDDLEDRQTYCGWYTITEDKNDTYEEVMARKRQVSEGEE